MSAINRWRGALLAALLRAGYPAFTYVAELLNFITPFNRQKYITRRQTRRQRIETGHAFEVLQELQRIALATGAALFPVSGTLLGLHRNGGILPHDVDIDVGLFAWDTALKPFLEAARQSTYCRYSKLERLPIGYRSLNPWLPALEGNVVCHKLAMVPPHATEGRLIEVDIFVHFRSDNYIVHGIANRLWLNSEYSLVPRRFGALEMLVPADTIRYLRENYGDFETEVLEFENLVDCPNCELVNGISAVFYLAKMRKIYALAGWTARLQVLDAMYLQMLRQLRLGENRSPGWKIRGMEQLADR